MPKLLSGGIGRLEIVVFVSGFAIMVIEIAGTRVLAPFFGNSLFTWTGLISVVLASLSVGYYLGGRLADKNPQARNLSFLLLLPGVFIALLPLFSDAVLGLSGQFGLVYGSFFASVALFSVPTLLLGAITPYAVRLKANNIRVVGESAGNLYAIATMGSILGVLLSGYVLVPYFGMRESFFALSVVLALAGVALLGRKSLPALIIVVLLGIVQPQQLNTLGGNLIYQKDSPYYQVQVIDHNNIRYLKTDMNLQSAISTNSTALEFSYYIYHHLFYANDPNIKSAMYIGLGGGAMVSDLQRNSSASVDVVEIDPVIIQVADRYFGVSESAGTRIYNEDARVFLQNTSKKYDLIVVDAFGSDASMPYELTTLEAAEEMKSHLNSDGTLFVNIPSSFQGDGSGVFKSFYKTFGTVFPNLYVFPTRLRNLTRPQNIVIVATSAGSAYSSDYFIKKLNGTMGIGGYYNGTIDVSGYPVLTDDRNPIESYALPLLMFQQKSYADGG